MAQINPCLLQQKFPGVKNMIWDCKLYSGTSRKHLIGKEVKEGHQLSQGSFPGRSEVHPNPPYTTTDSCQLFGWLSRASTCLGSSSQCPARDFWHFYLSCQGNSSSSCWSRWLCPKKAWSSGLLVSLERGVSCPRWCSCLAMQRGSFPYFPWWWGGLWLWWSGVTAQGRAWPTALGHFDKNHFSCSSPRPGD